MNVKSIELSELIIPAKKNKAGQRSHLPILSMTMKNGLVDQATKFSKRIASVDVSPYNAVKRGQLVVGFPIDEAVLSIQDKYELAIVSPAYSIWDIDTQLVEPKFLELFLRSHEAISFYKAKLQGSTARRRTLPPKTFLSMKVPLPAMEIQQRLISTASKLDEYNLLLNQISSDYESLLRALYEKSFILSDSAIPQMDIQDCLKFSSGKFLPHSEMNNLGDVPVYGANGVIGFHDQSLYKEPLIIVGRVGSCGKVNVTSGPAWVSDNAFVVSWKQANFLFEFLRYSLEYAELGKYASKSSQPLISLSRISKVKIPVPSLDQQEDFIFQLRAIREAQAGIELLISKSIELHESLQNRAFKYSL